MNSSEPLTHQMHPTDFQAGDGDFLEKTNPEHDRASVSGGTPWDVATGSTDRETGGGQAASLEFVD